MAIFSIEEIEEGMEYQISVKKLFEFYLDNDGVYASYVADVAGNEVVHIGGAYTLIRSRFGICAENTEHVKAVGVNYDECFANFISTERDEPVEFTLFAEDIKCCLFSSLDVVR